MRRQGGFLLPAFGPWLIYAGLAAAALAALWWAYSTIDGRGYGRGVAETTADYAKRDNQALRDALARVAQLQAEIRGREREHEARIAAIAEQHTQEQINAKNQRDRDVAAARAGALRLRDPGTTARTADCDRSPAGQAGAAAAGSDDPARGELSGAAAEFLLQLVHDADRNTRQLTACQQVISAQLSTCNGLESGREDRK